ncbi:MULTISPECIES: hypothetical protein [Elizabethkingia]|uniref:Uncharacterized protein n=1 Tax=Elizabethkingia anophelis TaxID=1117645 RepID=A0A494J1B1_9FLAO|nr:MULTISPECIES: hypothetical protein [Elizabethkingia]AQX52462.1 hypothetical protein AYC66_18040 [Elizabethkingia anophelis]MDV3554513.1 hypothetical protein [Elizabethkingia anophelis]MDV3612651.1 hypothetical protein [Elizabethkingia anophelis]MDV3631984.1 hypothetical protein [Elizabethkingia anophelis]MDV3655198.1 hypothetical protein [Elizabethkingia anophelis]
MKIEVGQVISEEDSKVLRDFISKNDIADISMSSGMSISTLRDVAYRRNRVAETNIEGLKKLIERASENASKQERHARKCKNNFKTTLNTI